jgi:hypothetical protein
MTPTATPLAPGRDSRRGWPLAGHEHSLRDQRSDPARRIDLETRMRAVAVVFIAASVASRAVASDGRIEINQHVVLAAGGFPFVIRQAGSYVLTGDLTLTAGSITAIPDSRFSVGHRESHLQLLDPGVVRARSRAAACPPAHLGAARRAPPRGAAQAHNRRADLDATGTGGARVSLGAAGAMRVRRPRRECR